MERKICSNCGFAVSNKSTWCPKCGVPAPRFGNGRLIAIVVSGVIVLLVVAATLLVWQRAR